MRSAGQSTSSKRIRLSFSLRHSKYWRLHACCGRLGSYCGIPNPQLLQDKCVCEDGDWQFHVTSKSSQLKHWKEARACAHLLSWCCSCSRLCLGLCGSFLVSFHLGGSFHARLLSSFLLRLCLGSHFRLLLVGLGLRFCPSLCLCLSCRLGARLSLSLCLQGRRVRFTNMAILDEIVRCWDLAAQQLRKGSLNWATRHLYG